MQMPSYRTSKWIINILGASWFDGSWTRQEALMTQDVGLLCCPAEASVLHFAMLHDANMCELLWHGLTLHTHPVHELRPHACLLSAVASWHKCDGHRPVRQKRQPAAHVEASGGIQGSCVPNNAKSRRRGPLYLLLSRSLSAFVKVELERGKKRCFLEITHQFWYMSFDAISFMQRVSWNSVCPVSYARMWFKVTSLAFYRFICCSFFTALSIAVLVRRWNFPQATS